MRSFPDTLCVNSCCLGLQLVPPPVASSASDSQLPTPAPASALATAMKASTGYESNSEPEDGYKRPLMYVTVWAGL